MSWAEDYTGKLVGEEACAAPTTNPAAASSTAGSASQAQTQAQVQTQAQAQAQAQAQTCLHLSLNAARKGVTYQRIELWLGKTRHEPVRADLYVLSDKLAKQARFVMDQPAAPTMVTEMVLTDQVSNHKTTHVRYLSRKERVVPPEWLNPMFLVRNPPLE